MKSLERHFFAGGNTKYGFFSYFSHIVNPKTGRRTYILKGGSGVGKSTMMRAFAQVMKEKQYFVEYIHCASDEDSLDAICIPELGITMLDGTAPHTVDPILPGAFDQIVNMGEWLNQDILKKQKEEIASISEEKSHLYKEAYSYMKSASHILDINNDYYNRNTDFYKIVSLADELSDGLFHERFGQLGTKRYLFADAFTSNGFIDYSHTLVSKIPSKHAQDEAYDIWEVSCESMCAIAEFMKKIADNGVGRGYNVECFCFPTEPHMIQHLLIPSLGVAIMSRDTHGFAVNKIDLNNFLDSGELAKQKDVIKDNEVLFSQLMNLSSQTLGKTKKQHDLLEHIYASAMDYTKVDLLVEQLLTKYLGSEGAD